ncbi:GNAT family N-acetyltransferase [Bifidobacterium gallicum]|nr:GNAT family N-acetyltransferase [Bifidobacterium gallicum]
MQYGGIVHSHLIIVEGLPGSGKSTTAQMIADELRRKGKTVVCVDEGDANHPADYADYDFPDFEAERTAIYTKWRAFVDQADADTIYVFNCVLLQNPMCETMMRFDMDADASQTYIAGMADIIKPLNPIIVYIDEPDVRTTIDRVLDERGDGWLNAVIDYHVGQAYGKHHNLQGYDGYIACLKERKRRELAMLPFLGLDWYSVSQDMSVQEFASLFTSVAWSLPAPEQMESALRHSTKSFVVRHNGNAVATMNWLGDYGMHWFMKECIVNPAYQGQLIGTLLYRFSKNFIISTMRDTWKTCVDLRSAPGTEPFYSSLGFAVMSGPDTGYGMETMLEHPPSQ